MTSNNYCNYGKLGENVPNFKCRITDGKKLKNGKKHERTNALNVNLSTITVVVQLQETLRRKEKQWDKERQMMEADKLAAETDARQKDDVIRSKDQLIAQKNELVAEKDAALRDRLEALQLKVYLLAYLFELFTE